MNYIEILARGFSGVSAYCIGNPYNYENIVWESGAALPSKATLDASAPEIIKTDKWFEIKAERDMRKAGGVKVGNYWFHSDDASRIQQIGLVMMGANIPVDLQWKSMTGEFVTMTQTLAMQIFSAIAAYDSTIFTNTEVHKAAMIASADPANYDFSSGWPLIYGE